MSAVGVEDVHDRGAYGPPQHAGQRSSLGGTRRDCFRAIYLTYHRRDGPRSGLTAASRAVLGHLTHTGPLTIGEAALHLDRAQSVVSEIVDGRRAVRRYHHALVRELRDAHRGRWCTYCTTDSGELQPFEERFARMVAWQERRHPEQSGADAEAATLAYLATMPAWRDHPRVTAPG